MKISFNIPTTRDDYLVLRSWFIKQFKILKFKVWGFRCGTCNTKLFYRAPVYESTVHGKRFIGESWLNYSKPKPYCVDCLREELLKRDTVFTENVPCDWCGSLDGHSATWFNNHPENYKDKYEPQFTFGSNWWNGHFICKKCLSKALTKDARCKSSHFVYDKKDNKTYSVNELGVKDKSNTAF